VAQHQRTIILSVEHGEIHVASLDVFLQRSVLLPVPNVGVGEISENVLDAHAGHGRILIA
jgi:hypothetical protein